MKRAVLIVALLLLGCSFETHDRLCPNQLAAAPNNKEVQPIAVFLEFNPWASLLGSESPRLALYSDGLVIFQKGDGFRSVRLPKKEADEFRTSLDIDALACVTGSYETTQMTDLPTDFLFIGHGGKLAMISVYGPVDDKGIAALRRLGDKHAGSNVPAVIMRAYDNMASFDHPNAQPWLPEKIEVVLWPYDDASQPSIHWPKTWPSLDSKDAVKWGDKYSVYLPAAENQRLIAFLSSRNEKGAIEVGGKKWVASIRYPFPKEASWKATIFVG